MINIHSGNTYRYASEHNFVGEVIEGYEDGSCVLTVQAVEALSKVVMEVAAEGYLVKVYDCYRPVRAVEDFVRWGKNVSRESMREEFYPAINRSDIFPTYVATRSAHSRGSTMDLTLVLNPAGPNGVYHRGDKLFPCTNPEGQRFLDNSIDMGTGFDCFSPMAATNTSLVGPIQAQNRRTLLTVMQKHGFINDPDEWWHFTLAQEPFPETYFDFPIVKPFPRK